MIHFDQVTYTYPDADRPALQDATFALAAGTLTLVVGPSGAGKSTLLRCLNGLAPHFSGGTLTGEITVAGLNPVVATPRVMSRHVGFVFQEPEGQFVMDRVEDEIAFALENAGLPRAEMRDRVAEVLALLALTRLRDRALTTLSGGEQQRVAIAAALALRPALLVLDEPTSQLDPFAAEEVLQAVTRLKTALGLTIVLAEHRLERVLPFTDQVLYVPGGGPPRVGAPVSMLAGTPFLPPVGRLGKMLGWSPLPLTVDQARPFVETLARQALEALAAPLAPERVRETPPLLEAAGVTVAFDRAPVLRDVDLAVHGGELLALLGPNGAGKTTLLRCLVGLMRLAGGVIRVAGQDVAGRSVADICRHVGYLPQDPNALLFADSVLEELHITLRNHNLEGAPPVEPEALLARLGLAEKAGAYPRDLSVGERQRVALGAVAVTAPPVLLLDEPTRGLDVALKEALGALLRAWCDEGKGILLVTHDVEWVARFADRVAILDQGKISISGTPREVFTRQAQFVPQWVQLLSSLH